MNDFVAELKKRRVEAMERRRTAEREIEAINVLLAQAEGREITDPELSFLEDKAHIRIQRIKRPPGTARKLRQDIINACRRHLLSADRPVRRVDLLSMLQADGITMPSADPRSYLSSLLWNNKDQILNFYELGYWLADRPYPPIKFLGQKGEIHPLILSKQTGLRALHERNFMDGRDEVEEYPPDDGPN